VAETLAIIGMGNTSMGDDGIGVILLAKLREELESGAWRPETSMHVELITAGRDAVLAGACLMDASAALLVDAAEMNADAGEFRVFSPDDAFFRGDRSRIGTHTLPLGEVLEMVRGLGSSTRVRLMGVQPKDMHPGQTVSGRLCERMPEMLNRIKEEVSLLP
jgi:hydrogenase maturation protease